jgi:cyanophycinase-like exopeptidase
MTIVEYLGRRETQRESDDAQVEVARSDDVAQHFEDVAQLLATLDIDQTWKAATDVEHEMRRRNASAGGTIAGATLLVHQLVAAGQHVLELPPPLASRVRELWAGADPPFRRPALDTMSSMKCRHLDSEMSPFGHVGN